MPPVFTVGWVCALPDELAAARVVMDERYEPLPSSPTDTNVYRFGRIGVHDVVAACLPAGQIGTNSAAVVASHMRNSFPSLRFVLLVGIGGGVPSDEHDIRLGDVVISQPAARHGGVVQFDFGKTVSGGEFTRIGSLNAPPTILLSALANLRTDISLDEVHTTEHLSAFANHRKFTFPGSSQDVLYSATSEHVPGPTCASCRKEDIIVRHARHTPDPVLFFGTIASGNQVMKDGSTRDRISQDLGGVLCFEMEAAGLMNNFECLVVRGICDYADSHKNKQWQPYAAATAAACAKELLLLVPQALSATGNSQMAHPTLPVRSTVPSLSDEDRDCLRSLAFPEQESRGQEIHFAQNTCQWLLMDYQYWDWTKKDRGLFWVKGSPGTGKSALMKCAATTMRYKQPGDLVISYFIHGRGTDLQKSILGVFRALLNTILASLPQYLSHLTKTFKDREERYGSYQEKRWTWSVQDLQDCMLETLSKGAKDKPVIIFIDALDECGEHDAKALLSYFRDLMQQIVLEGGKVKICFSSRHYPILGSDNIPTVSVENQNGTDIQLVVHERLAQIDPGERRQQIEQIERHILRKSQGGFQWAVLVTDKILEGEMTGMKETNLLKMLTRIPETLDGLYGDILSSSNGAPKQQMVKLFQWILFARRPLSSQELREALATDKDTASATIYSLRRHDSWVEDLSQFEKHVKHLSKGLVEFQDRDVWEQHEPDGEPWNREAQFIHQSVADYLVEKFLTRGDEERNTARSVAGAGHFELSRSCCRYITMGDVQVGASLPRGSFSVRFPLAPYAAQFLFRHICEVEREGFPQLDLLSLIKWDQPKSIRQLAHLWSVLDPDHAHAPKGWPFIGATPLHVLIAFGSQSAVKALLLKETLYNDVRDAQGNTPLLLATRECHQEIALMLLDRSFEWSQRHIRAVHENIEQNHSISKEGSFDVDVNATNDEGDTPLSVALTMTKAGELILKLIKAGADVKRPRQKAQLFVYAIRNMDSALFMELITEYGSLDGAVYFVSREISSGNKGQILEVFLSELLKAGANTSRSWVFDGFSKTNNTDGHYSVVDPWDEIDDDIYGDPDDDSDEDEDEEAILLASRKGQASAVNLLLSHNVSPNSLNSSGESPLNLAAYGGHIEIVKLLLENGATSLNTTNDSGNTPLNLAASRGHIDIVGLLLKQDDIGLNTADIHGNTPLITAIYEGHIEIVKLLLENSATSINTTNDGGNSPLNLSAFSGHIEIVGLLLEKGDIDLKNADDDGDTPLFAAASNRHIEIVELLLGKGDVGLDTANNSGITPLISAVANRHIEIVKLLLDQGADPNFAGVSVTLPLHTAVTNHWFEIAEMLLEKGADPNVQRHDGQTPLFQAVIDECLEFIGPLLAKGADPNVVDNTGQTPFLLAVAARKIEISSLLLAKGARLDLSNRDGDAPLILACYNDSFDMIEMLLAKGAHPDITNRNGATSLLIAVTNGHFEMTSLLLAKGASPDITDANGTSPLSHALRDGQIEIFRLLLEMGAKPDVAADQVETALDEVFAFGDLSIAGLLLKRIADMDAADSSQRVLLYLASTGKYIHLVDGLLQSGVDPDTTSYSGCTPLDLAAAGRHLEVAKLLLAHGANPNVASKNGRVPLSTASASGHLEVVRLFLEKGACIFTLDDDGRTPIYNAMLGGHLQIARVLLEKGANPNFPRSQGRTPYEIISARQYLEIAELLIEEAAEPPTAQISMQSIL